MMPRHSTKHSTEIPERVTLPFENRKTGFFDFLRADPNYSMTDLSRMNCRHDMIIAPFKAELHDARVLDLAAHDGRWSYALAGAGARSVLGVEARQMLIDRYDSFPAAPFKDRVQFHTGDLFDTLDQMIATQERFDVVALFGILYHVMDHFRLLRQVTALRPDLVIIDSEFISSANPMIQLVRERTDNPLNAIPQHAGQETAIVGIPSTVAVERIAEALNYRCDWLDWDALPPEKRRGVRDYFRAEKKRRRSCVLRPKRSQRAVMSLPL